MILPAAGFLLALGLTVRGRTRPGSVWICPFRRMCPVQAAKRSSSHFARERWLADQRPAVRRVPQRLVLDVLGRYRYRYQALRGNGFTWRRR